MQNLNKLLKILIISFVLLACGTVSYFVFFKQKKALNLNEKNIIKQDPAQELLQNNSEALKKAENINNGLVRKIDSADHLMGDVNAPVQIIIYDDFDNEYSSDYYRTVMQALQANKEKIAVAYRHFPMRSHANSNIAAIASECASDQGKFWEMADKLFLAKTEEKLFADNIDMIAGDLKLDQEKFKTCLTDAKISDKIQASITEADNINVTGAPTTFINSVPYPGALPYEDFKDSSGLERKGLSSIIGELLK